MLSLIINSEITLIVKVLVSIVLIVIMFLLQIQTYTQDSGAPTAVKILNSIKATRIYNTIEEDKFTTYNRQEQIVYNAKFNKNSQSEYFSLWHSESQLQHRIKRIDDRIHYDQSQLELIKTTIPNQIVETQPDGSKRTYELESIDKLLEIENGGYKDWSVRKFESKLVGYEKVLDRVNRRKENR